MSAAIFMSLLLPLVLALCIVAGGRPRIMGVRGAPLAPLPAALLLLIHGDVRAGYSWLLLGSTFGLDLIGRIFLLLTSLLWLGSALYSQFYFARGGKVYRFWFFFLLTFCGNLAAVLAQDVVTFYAGFAVMTFSAYGLIVHEETPAAFRAGRIYIAMAVIGEACLLAGTLLAAFSVASTNLAVVSSGIAFAPLSNLTIALLTVGFGIKAGAIPLHIWLPLAHPVAPTPASAVLSGVMIKVGLLGWLRFFPLGHALLSGWGGGFVIAALLAAFFGVLVGITQRDPKTALAYSSISQIGLIAVVIGSGLGSPAGWPTMLAGCLIYALHHGLIKACLFLGVGVAQTNQRGRVNAILVTGTLCFLALSLAGFPLTTGALAKVALTSAIGQAAPAWVPWLQTLLPLAAVGTTVLMGHFVWLVWQKYLETPPERERAGLLPSWIALILVGTALTWAVPTIYALPVDLSYAFTAGALWASTWPVLLGAGLLWIFETREKQIGLHPIPAGDLVLLIERPIMWSRSAILKVLMRPSPTTVTDTLGSRWYGLFAESRSDDRSARLRRHLSKWPIAGALFLSVMLLMTWLLVVNGV